MKSEDMPEFHEQQRIMKSNTERAIRLAEQHGVTLNGGEMMAQRLEHLIDFILPDDGDDDDVTKARVRFELEWSQRIASSLDAADQKIRAATIDPMGLAKKPSGLIVPGR